MAYIRVKTLRKIKEKRAKTFKLKANKSASKRYSITGSGIVMSTQSGKRHNMSQKSKRQLLSQTGKTHVISKGLAKRIKKRYNIF
jgi:large subunit ribosomal protein L35